MAEWLIGHTSRIVLHASGYPDWLDFTIGEAHNASVTGHKE
jgi:hypothetical protein